MKRILKLFVLTPPEQRVLIVLILLVLAAAWFKHNRDLQNSVGLHPTPQGAAVSTPPPEL